MTNRTKALTAGDHYNLPYWSEGYAQVNQEGELCIHPTPENSASINLAALSQRLKEQGVRLPTLVRFPEILHDRVRQLVQAFEQAQQESDYQGGFTSVYPIKVNQQQRVVAEIILGQQHFAQQSIGLEAGSKPELIAVLAQLQSQSNENTALKPATIVCNGYKDRQFIRLALMAEKIGHTVFLVIEKLSELPLILDEAKQLNVSPRIGIRARLATIGKGNWQNTGGEKSKFGLSANQILKLIDQLKQQGKIDCLQLLHFHLGSQLANIQDIQQGLTECGRLYAEMMKLEVPIRWLDVGGGLGVDYEGTRSRSYCSMNYSMEEYARRVVSTFKRVCQQQGISEPHIMTESGRAMTAHHAVLLADIVDQDTGTNETLSPLPTGIEHDVISTLYQHYESCHRTQVPDGRSFIELYHDVQHMLSELHAGFNAGSVSIETRAYGETLANNISAYLRQHLQPSHRYHRELLDELHEKHAEKIFVNLSVFQSLPDVWGIDQIFPIAPLSGLHNPVAHRVVVQDITCDSDGRIDRYVDADGLETSLPLPRIKTGDILAFFMVGAYQEILGDMHNLFGDTDSVDVVLNEQGEAAISDSLKGDAVADVLEYVNFDERIVLQSLHEFVDSSDLSDANKSRFKAYLSDALTAYTYLS